MILTSNGRIMRVDLNDHVEVHAASCRIVIWMEAQSDSEKLAV